MKLQIQPFRFSDKSFAVPAQLARMPVQHAYPDCISGRGVLLYSCNGLLVVHSDAGRWVVPPTAVLRLASGSSYYIRKADQVFVQQIELDDDVSHCLPVTSSLHRVTPLLRELLNSFGANSVTCASTSKTSLLVELLLEAGVWHDDVSPRCMSVPEDNRVAYICDYVHNNLDTPKTLQEWAAELRHDTRTLHRLFVREFGMSFVQWRQQARLMAALEWLAEGRPVMDVALDLGYQTQSAFTAMFRRQIGITPTAWQNKRHPVACNTSVARNT